MMKEKNKGKKTLAAVGAVVAAGLTPGIIAASAAGTALQGSNAGITAADVVAIDGTTYSFDELYAMQRGEPIDTIEMNIVLEPDTSIDLKEFTVVVKYGVQRFEHNAAKAVGNDETVYISTDVEQMPQFPGGEVALMKYIDSHINYPPEAAKNNVKGKVVVQFVVKKDGSIGEVKVLRSVDKDLDKEAIRVVKSLPKFTPGRQPKFTHCSQKGQAVNVWYTLPVTFKLK
ncbi:MAG: TonB family protein [Muribaculaceae bacterium]|nr:TonB family protein [Muribaculaceae bacterium]